MKKKPSSNIQFEEMMNKFNILNPIKQGIAFGYAIALGQMSRSSNNQCPLWMVSKKIIGK